MQNKAKAGELTLKEAAKTCISPIADTPKPFKILKSAAICLSFLLTGLNVEIIGPALPDLKLQMMLYRNYEFFGLGLSISSLAIIIGVLLIFCNWMFFRCQNTCSKFFCYSAKIDLLLSFAFLLCISGTILITTLKSTNIELMFLILIFIGISQGIIIIAGAILLLNLWHSSKTRLFGSSSRFLILAIYAIGGLFAALLVRFCLTPISFTHRQHYQTPISELLQALFQSDNPFSASIATTTTSTTSTTSASTRRGQTTPRSTRPTTRTTLKALATSPLANTDINILDFVRYDSFEDGTDKLTRLFENNLNYPFYVIAALNAILMISFLILYTLECKIASCSDSFKTFENLEMKISSPQTEIQPLESSKLQKMKNCFIKMLNFSIIDASVSSVSHGVTKSKPINDKFLKTTLPNFCFNIVHLLAIMLSYFFAFGSFKMQANFLFSYCIQPEFVDISTIISNGLIDSLNNPSSGKEIALSFIEASYVQAVFFAGITIGLTINFFLLKNRFFSLKPIQLLYMNIAFNALVKILSVSFELFVINEKIWSHFSEFIGWCILMFFNGFFVVSIVPLLHEYFIEDWNCNSNAVVKFSLKQKYIYISELLGLVLGAAFSQFFLSMLIHVTQTFDSFMNMQLAYALAIVIFFLVIHFYTWFVPKRYRIVNPN